MLSLFDKGKVVLVFRLYAVLMMSFQFLFFVLAKFLNEIWGINEYLVFLMLNLLLFSLMEETLKRNISSIEEQVKKDNEE